MNRVETNLKTAIRTIAALCLLLAMLVSATATAQDSFSPNFGVSGSWVNPDSPGQGFFFDVNPETGLFWASWFTYTDEETTHSPVIGAVDNDWFVALGTLDGQAPSHLP